MKHKRSQQLREPERVKPDVCLRAERSGFNSASLMSSGTVNLLPCAVDMTADTKNIHLNGNFQHREVSMADMTLMLYKTLLILSLSAFCTSFFCLFVLCRFT